MTRKWISPGSAGPVVALVAVAIVAVWWWQRGGSEPAKPTAKVVADSAAAPAKAPEPEPRTGNVELAQRVLIDDDPKGALRLEGQVVDASDQPAAGVTVVLASNPSRTTTSEADGGFAFDALVGRPYTLVARGAGATAGKIAGPVTAQLTTSSDPVVLKLRDAGKLVVSVASSDGKPIEGATVELRGIDEQRETSKAGGTATFASVVPGGYQIAAWATGMARTFQWIQIGAGDAEARVTLTAGAPVSGRVVDDKGGGIAGARVRFSGASDWSQQASDRHDAAVTTKDGSFKLEAMPAGTFRFVATHPAHAPGTSALVTLDAKSPRDGVTITLAAGAVVRGRVLDTAQQPVASARVRVGVQTNPRAMIFEAPRQAFTDAAGAFELAGLPRRPLSAVALHDSGASETQPIDTTNGDVTDVKLVIDVTGTIAGVVVDPLGQPMEGVQVKAGPSFGDNRTPTDVSQWRLRGFPQALTDGAGKFQLAGLAPGTYTISAAPAASRAARSAFGGEGHTAKTGDTNVRIVLPPEGAVTGKVAFADGTPPPMFTVSVGMTGQPGRADGTFVLDGLAPQKYELNVRGPSFQTRVVEVTVESTKTADAGTITVEKGRSISGRVVADGQPVGGATVFAGRMIFGNGTSSSAQFGPMGAGTKKDTTDASGAFVISGFGPGEITVVAEHEAIGRSRGMRLPTVMPGQTELVLVLEKFGALTGVLRQAGKPAEGVFVTCQSTTTPGAIYSVASGPDGTYRFDRLAPDVYKVSAMLGMPMTGMKFYSKQIEVPPGKEVTIDLAVEPGAVTLDVTSVPKAGKLGVASVWLASGAIRAKSMNELGLAMAAAGPGASQLVIVRRGEPARFAEVVPGSYSACVVPYPAEVKGMAAMGYSERHGDTMLAFCKTVTIAPSPDSQTTSVTVELPPFIPDAPPAGPGNGSGSGSP